MASFGRSSSVSSYVSDNIESHEDTVTGTQRADVVMESVEKETLVIKPQKGPEKRARQDSEEDKEGGDEDGFITVNRRPKRLLRSFSENREESISGKDIGISEGWVINISAKEVLPKQFGMAKLLKAENINNILRIKYKTPYKINVLLKHKEDADKLLNCKKFQELDYRCQCIDEVNLSYGVVKNVDLDIEEKEIFEQFTSEYEIVTIRRLQRLAEDKKWVDSTVIRLAFKSSTLPSYIFGYGCRFKVEPYVFPVTQCSGCWKFGHIRKVCPTRKIKCPKCGQDHENCLTTQFVCINCKGPHMALDKRCPVFAKEKMIKNIMSQNNCTYKKALVLYQQRNAQESITKSSNNSSSENQDLNTHPISYKDILLGNCKNHLTSTTLEENKEKEGTVEVRRIHRQSITKKKNETQKKSAQESGEESGEGEEEELQNQQKKASVSEETTSSKDKGSKIINIFYKINEIILSKKSLEDKICLCVQHIIEQVTSIFFEKRASIIKGLFYNVING